MYLEHACSLYDLSLFPQSYSGRPVIGTKVVLSSKVSVLDLVSLIVRIFMEKYFPGILKFMRVTSTTTGVLIVTLDFRDCPIAHSLYLGAQTIVQVRGGSAPSLGV